MHSAVPSLRKLTGLGRRLADDTRGAILLFSAILLIFVLGTGGLVLDFARVWNAQSELQSFADHAALTAAGELDGNDRAIARATAALNLATNRQHYAAGNVRLDSTSLTPTFLSDLPADDTDNNFAPFVTADDAEARFVLVRVNPYTVSTIFADILLRFSGNAGVDIGVGANAVAGYTQFACDITPLMFCTPANYEPVRGRMIEMVSGGGAGGGFWGPGNFGFLDLNFDPEGPCGRPNPGADYYRCAMALSRNVSRCFAQRGVNTAPGRRVGAVSAGFNTRFDMYSPPLRRTNPDIAPAPNVVKGLVPANAQCSQMDPATTVAMPRDTCFISGTCGGDERFGNGTENGGRDWSEYYDLNHDNSPPATVGANPTRYEMYLAEIAAAPNNGGTILPAGKDETGSPVCNTPAAEVERRSLIAAAVDCETNRIAGNMTGVPVEMFVEIFMTEPSGTTGDDSSIYVEEVGDASTGASGVIRNVVQLYR